ncbi:MAG: molybdopterin-dependent oxidoreductase, partial [Chloroflexi bacterium]|nr:molybdopterin-dependent oxidoreductase [Chloroflexota bacterium]
EALEIDPVELRMRNILREGALLSVGSPLPKGVSMPQVVEKCAEASEWRMANGERRLESDRRPETGDRRPETVPCPPSPVSGRGFACGFKNVGFSFGAPEQCWATVELHGDAEIERAVVRHAAAEVGQGTHTAISQMTAEALGIPFEKVEFIGADTAKADDSGSVSASRMTFMSGNSVKGAAERALDKWENGERPAVSTYQYRPPATTPYDPETGAAMPNFSYGYVAQAVEVEVDTETGFVRIVDVISANDVGKAINPQQVEGQTEGAVVQAAGYAILENFIQQDGYVKTSHLSSYLIPTVLDVPDRVKTVILEYPDPIGPWGARGMGEMPFIPLTPAIIAAVHDATGVWFDDFPLTPERVLRGLGRI